MKWKGREKEYAREYNRKRNRRVKVRMLEMHGTTSCKCGESRPWCLVFHHRNPDEKSFGIAVTTRRSYPDDELVAELAKCDVMCHNCHANLHYEEN